MKKFYQSKRILQSPWRPWRQWCTSALLVCASAFIQPAYAQDPSANEAVLNFVGADIESVIRAVGHYINTTFIIDPRVKGTVNLVSEKPVTKAQAFEMLTSVLRLQGYAVVSGPGFTKVVPEADAKLQAGPILTGPIRGDQIATQVFRLNYESAPSLVPILRPIISPNNTINANPSNNTLVITDYADNLRRLGRIIAALDSPSAADVEVLPIRHAIATDLAVMVSRLLDATSAVGGTPGAPSAPGAPGSAGTITGADGGRTILLADSRTNSIILRAPSAARANLAKSLITRLDQPTAMPGNVHVVYLKNAEAIKLAQTLRAVIATDSTTSGASTTQASTPVNPALSGPGSPGYTGSPTSLTGGGASSTTGMQLGLPSATTTQPALSTGGPGGFIQADPATNALIITASEAVYRNLRFVIEQLDARRAQVYVESLIIEVNNTLNADFGIQWAGLSGSNDSRFRIGAITGFTGAGSGNNLISFIAARVGAAAGGSTTPTTLTAPGNGLNLGLFRQANGSLELGAIARALETQGGVNILSMPNLITLDNEEARIIVGQNVPFVTGSYSQAAVGGVNPFQTVERKDVGLTLSIRPQISEGGTVKMAIYQENSSIDDSRISTSGFITNKRAIQTNVLVDDGQIIVLGGLIGDDTTDGTEKVPALGDIPVIGNLFKFQTRRRSKSNLMVFLRPTVIRTNEQSIDVTSDRYNYIRNQELGHQPVGNLILPTYGAPVVPPIADGRIGEGPLLNLRPSSISYTPPMLKQDELVPQPQQPGATVPGP